jgi:hypothetical protein
MEMLFWAAIRTGPEGCDPISGPGSLLTSDGAINSAPKEPSWLSLSLTLRLTGGEAGISAFPCRVSQGLCMQIRRPYPRPPAGVLLGRTTTYTRRKRSVRRACR